MPSRTAPFRAVSFRAWTRNRNPEVRSTKRIMHAAAGKRLSRRREDREGGTLTRASNTIRHNEKMRSVRSLPRLQGKGNGGSLARGFNSKDDKHNEKRRTMRLLPQLFGIDVDKNRHFSQHLPTKQPNWLPLRPLCICSSYSFLFPSSFEAAEPAASSPSFSHCDHFFNSSRQRPLSSPISLNSVVSLLLRDSGPSQQPQRPLCKNCSHLPTQLLSTLNVRAPARHDGLRSKHHTDLSRGSP